MDRWKWVSLKTGMTGWFAPGEFPPWHSRLSLNISLAMLEVIPGKLIIIDREDLGWTYVFIHESLLLEVF